MDAVDSIFWFRRDLRLEDNAGLYYALKSSKNVQCIFIFDENILEKLENKQDTRVAAIHLFLQQLQQQLKPFNAAIKTYFGKPEVLFSSQILKDFPNVTNVYSNCDYEPYAHKRDTAVSAILAEKNIGFNAFKDQVLFHKSEVVKKDGTPYLVFTPYYNAFKEKLNPFYLKSYPTLSYSHHFAKASFTITSLKNLGFKPVEINIPTQKINDSLFLNYNETRDFPATEGTSKLSLHLRFGTISIRKLAKHSLQIGASIYFKELVWREFYQMILWHFPHVVNRAFKPKYDFIPWRNNPNEFELWCQGKTGIPLVDAGMRELNATGYMHNRVRMVVASFLCKNLLIDWRWGEAYFAEKLLDYDLAANNGGWQWAAGSGCDAAPYFRVFNPETQAKKFDPHSSYIRKWIPELDEFSYPKPMVDLKESRIRAIEAYKSVLN